MNAQTIAMPELRAVPIGELHEHPLNARRTFHAETMKELLGSIRDIGIKTPLLVRENGKKGFQIIGGHRRYRCAKELGLDEVPVLVQQLDDDKALELMLIDNLQREGLHELEEAEGYKTLMTKAGYSVDRIAEKVGRSIKYVYDRVKLLQLIPALQKVFRDGEITAGHAIILARLTPEDQKRILGDEDASPLFKDEQLLFSYRDDEDDKTEREQEKAEALARRPISVRETQAWVDKHVKLEASVAKTEPLLFPETVDTLKEAEATHEKVIRITHEVITPLELHGKDAPKVVLGNSWKRADGKRGTKTCDFSMIGMTVIGARRGETLRVCVAKQKCATHWPDHVKRAKKREAEAAKAAKSTVSPSPKAGAVSEKALKAQQAAEAREAARVRKEREEQARRKREAERWDKAEGAIVLAIAAALKKAPASAASALGQFVIEQVSQGAGGAFGEADRHVGKGKTGDDLVRYLAAGFIYDTMDFQGQYYGDPEKARLTFAGEMKKLLGVDLVAIVNDAVPPDAEPKSPKKAAAKKSRKK